MINGNPGSGDMGVRNFASGGTFNFNGGIITGNDVEIQGGATLTTDCADQLMILSLLDADLNGLGGGDTSEGTCAQAAMEPIIAATSAVTRPSRPYSSNRVPMIRRRVAPRTLSTAAS